MHLKYCKTSFTKPIKADKFAAIPWVHDLNALKQVFRDLPFTKGKPGLVIAHTIKGKGISYMENMVKWHHGVPDEKQYQDALTELDNAMMTIPDDF